MLSLSLYIWSFVMPVMLLCTIVRNPTILRQYLVIIHPTDTQERPFVVCVFPRPDHPKVTNARSIQCKEHRPFVRTQEYARVRVAINHRQSIDHQRPNHLEFKFICLNASAPQSSSLSPLPRLATRKPRPPFKACGTSTGDESSWSLK